MCSSVIHDRSYLYLTYRHQPFQTRPISLKDTNANTQNIQKQSICYDLCFTNQWMTIRLYLPWQDDKRFFICIFAIYAINELTPFDPIWHSRTIHAFWWLSFRGVIDLQSFYWRKSGLPQSLKFSTVYQEKYFSGILLAPTSIIIFKYPKIWLIILNLNSEYCNCFLLSMIREYKLHVSKFL